MDRPEDEYELEYDLEEAAPATPADRPAGRGMLPGYAAADELPAEAASRSSARPAQWSGRAVRAAAAGSQQLTDGSDAERGDDYTAPSGQAAQQASLLPYMLGAFAGGILVGLLLLIVFLAQRPVTPQPNTQPGSPLSPGVAAQSTATIAEVGGATPPRMQLADFKQRYDSPATRPLIVDVRDADQYAVEHIAAAISIPEGEVDTRLGEIPRDKLVVLYCA